MHSAASTDRTRLLIAPAIATPGERRLAAILAAGAAFAFAVIVPFVRVPLGVSGSFIPSYEAALVCIDLVTAVMLFDHFLRLNSAAVLALAAGYLFDAMIIVPHALSFPGAFAGDGVIGGGTQTTAWLYVFWHGGFALFVLAYALLRRREERGALPPISQSRAAVLVTAAGVAALVFLLTALTVWGHDWLPVMIRGGDYSMAVTKGITPTVWVLTLIALMVLWQPQPRAIDLWLMLVMWVWLFDISLSSIIGSNRFDLGWYAGRIFGLIAASFLLVALLVELARFYTGALDAAASAELRLAELLRARPTLGLKPEREGADTFIERQNIANYRLLLGSATLDDVQRRAIEALLSEEEAKLTRKLAP
jgi:Membrane-associated sensor, integral membrane domain